jgi:hypothetical protein
MIFVHLPPLEVVLKSSPHSLLRSSRLRVLLPQTSPSTYLIRIRRSTLLSTISFALPISPHPQIPSSRLFKTIFNQETTLCTLLQSQAKDHFLYRPKLCPSSDTSPSNPITNDPSEPCPLLSSTDFLVTLRIRYLHPEIASPVRIERKSARSRDPVVPFFHPLLVLSLSGKDYGRRKLGNGKQSLNKLLDELEKTHYDLPC